MASFQPEIPQRSIQKILNAFTKQKVKGFRVQKLKGGFHNAVLKITAPELAPIVLQVAPLEETIIFWHERHMLKHARAAHAHLSKHRVPVPTLLHHDFSGRIIKHHYLIWSYVNGRNWHYLDKKLTPKQKDNLHQEWGKLTRKVHSIKGPHGFGFPSSQRKFATWSAFLLRYAQELDKVARKLKLLAPDDTCTPLSALKRHKDALDKIQSPRLIHGDLWTRNILLQKSEYQIQVLLDMERSVWGDPWYEWILYGMPLSASFWSGYGKGLPQSQAGRTRLHCYRALGLWQAALEKEVYFKHTGKAKKWMKDVKVHLEKGV